MRLKSITLKSCNYNLLKSQLDTPALAFAKLKITHTNPLIYCSMASSSPSQPDLQLQLQPETESQMSSIVYEISQEVQGAMENMLKMMSEIDENSAGITEEIEKCKEQSLEKKRGLEEAKEQVEKAAYAVLEMLNNRA
ncbi:PREDICTED: LOC18788379 [Prunus dulcis]|uniref:PREDICTED: LOC18788379 n=1 Tax=Prunus dulcis TaxID=3755 RepID=A0A5E4EH32_PRUDU|nr:PREDICTED: LOC18788379 [Prunus dulcis]